MFHAAAVQVRGHTCVWLLPLLVLAPRSCRTAYFAGLMLSSPRLLRLCQHSQAPHR